MPFLFGFRIYLPRTFSDIFICRALKSGLGQFGQFPKGKKREETTNEKKIELGIFPLSNGLANKILCVHTRLLLKTHFIIVLCNIINNTPKSQPTFGHMHTGINSVLLDDRECDREIEWRWENFYLIAIQSRIVLAGRSRVINET